MSPYPELDSAMGQLRTLVSRGFRFVHPRDDAGGVVAIVGVRAHDNVVDVIRLLGESNAEAVRMPGDEKDVMAPRTKLWHTSGPADVVLTQLLALPEPTAPVAAVVPTPQRPREARKSSGCWVPVRPGRTAWLPATS